jgi:hypothetical protein
MVNEGGHGWRVNGATGSVRYFNNEIHVNDKASSDVFNVKVKDEGLSRK